MKRAALVPYSGASVLLSPARAAQVKNMQRAADNANRAKEQQLGAYLQSVASAENAGSLITVLQTTPFKDSKQQVGLRWRVGSAAAHAADGVWPGGCCSNTDVDQAGACSSGRCWRVPPAAAAAVPAPMPPAAASIAAVAPPSMHSAGLCAAGRARGGAPHGVRGRAQGSGGRGGCDCCAAEAQEDQVGSCRLHGAAGRKWACVPAIPPSATGGVTHA